VLGPGRYARVAEPLYLAISSIRAASPQANAAARPAHAQNDIELYAATDFNGERYGSSRDVADLETQGRNDNASSMVVYLGAWELCTEANFSGRCAVFGPGRYATLLGFNNTISSMRRVH
jgi:hypothetical protein